jgi:hypothetical protein
MIDNTLYQYIMRFSLTVPDVLVPSLKIPIESHSQSSELTLEKLKSLLSILTIVDINFCQSNICFKNDRCSDSDWIDPLYTCLVRSNTNCNDLLYDGLKKNCPQVYRRSRASAHKIENAAISHLNRSHKLNPFKDSGLEAIKKDNLSEELVMLNVFEHLLWRTTGEKFTMPTCVNQEYLSLCVCVCCDMVPFLNMLKYKRPRSAR